MKFLPKIVDPEVVTATLSRSITLPNRSYDELIKQKKLPTLASLRWKFMKFSSHSLSAATVDAAHLPNTETSMLSKR